MPGVIHLLLGDRCYQRSLDGIRLCALPAASRGRHRQPIWACTPEGGRFNGPTCILSGLSQRLSPSAFSGAPQPLHRHPAGGRVVCSLLAGFLLQSQASRLAPRGARVPRWWMEFPQRPCWSAVSRPLARRLLILIESARN